MTKQKPRVAIVHDWLIQGGAERVVLELHRMYPEAPIYASYCTPEWRKKLDNKVITGFLQIWPFPQLRKFVPILRIWWFTHLDLSEYDIVISSSGAEAKGIITRAHTTHINYCHAPTHYYWSRYNEYMEQPGFGAFDPLARLGLRMLVGPLRRWDLKASKRPDVIIANSSNIQAQIKKYYKRDAEIISPPVDIERFTNTRKVKRTGFIAVGRQTPYKRIDLAVKACTKLDLPLTVIGRGPDHDRLVRFAGPTVTFRTDASDEEVVEYMRSADALLFPGLDDFGITPVEAMAAGTPVIAYKAGGALDYIEDGKTGVFFEKQTVDSLCDALQRFPKYTFDHRHIIAVAERFSPQTFRKRMTTAIQKAVANHHNS